jgi:hypothetical protein
VCGVPSASQQKISVPSSQFSDDEFRRVARVEQEFVSGKNSRVHFDDLQRVQIDAISVAADKSIETKGVRAQRRV